MKNKLLILKNLKNRIVIGYLMALLGLILIRTGLGENYELQELLDKVLTIVAILGIIDDPNSEQFLENSID
ncbi:MAG: hypothetical protein ACLUPE_13505 [Turicibacter sanguinis]|jgi:uncharacterized membrane protein|uniref:hypothetical protein n=2 Tax=Bacillota TaxID=1239 RepID=UPI003996A2D4